MVMCFWNTRTINFSSLDFVFFTMKKGDSWKDLCIQHLIPLFMENVMLQIVTQYIFLFVANLQWF